MTDKALEAALAQIQAHFGKGSNVRHLPSRDEEPELTPEEEAAERERQARWNAMSREEQEASWAVWEAENEARWKLWQAELRRENRVTGQTREIL